ncbi:thioesterase II family protein [Streptomyces sp. NPDC014894]|uniref:thioesterase II family protein n=1 Tax=Streptomyces sp. NPDC014894 TaxID=3364931 RepID=UPI003702402E
MNPFTRPLRNDDPALRLVVCHHAGGSGSAYFPLGRSLPPDWDLLLADLPGRGRRHREAPLRDLSAMVERLTEDVLPLTGPPLALFGHSMGAAVVAGTALALERRGAPVAWVGVSGRLAPADCGPVEDLDPGLSDRRLMAGLGRLGGIPARFDEAPEFRRRFLRLVRGDLYALGSAHPDPARRRLAAPLTAFGAAGDETAPASRLGGWAAETAGPFRSRVFDGGHFHFFDDGFAALGAALVAEIRRVVPGADGPEGVRRAPAPTTTGGQT